MLGESESDLATAIPGNRASAERCQRLDGDAPKAKRTSNNANRVRLRSTSRSDEPVRLTVSGPTARRARFTLDGDRIAGSRRGVTLDASQLSGRADHTLKVALTRGGRTGRATLRFKTIGCDRALSVASSSKGGSGNELSLRIDSASALSSVTFEVPAAVLAQVRSYSLLVLAAGDNGRRTYEYGVDRQAITPAGEPRLGLSGGNLTLTGLPRQTGVVRLEILTGAPRQRGQRFEATAVAGGQTERFVARTGR